MKSLFAALSFLSILPVPVKWTGQESDLAKSVKFFPVVGLVLGAIAAGFAWAAAMVFPPTVSAGLVIIAMVVLTRGLHLDGLADSADGFMSVSSKERMLEIMKDSRTGAMGVIAVASVLILKFACLSCIEVELVWRVVLLMVIVSRSMMAMSISVFPYARKEGGLGRLFYQTRTPLNAVWAIVVSIVAGGLTFEIAGIVAAVSAVIGTVVFGLYCKYKIGGVTGDTIGAGCEIIEVLTILILCGFLQANGL